MTKRTTVMKRTNKRITRRPLLREEDDHNQSTGTKPGCVCGRKRDGRTSQRREEPDVGRRARGATNLL
ncbi:hypothetical protein Pcinc_029554 [Petrolisthes cinctipes]|uniref:Uncharacterized protein n=1 Tax=Petrolisthes cinctipes TaxID=88211 RepID=A0AAE1K5P9_PETCI|nr:hypothetical protein Pcinc_029554 [Petrolisthes cinctipes]